MTVLAQQWVSLDGYASGDTDEQEIFAFIPAGGDDPGNEHNLRLLADVDTVLLGRNTYETFVQVWPTLDHPMAPLVNSLAKVVASRSLADAPWGEHRPAQVVADAARFVRGATGTVLVWGSLALMNSLLADGLLDELEVFVAPVLLGRGRPLLATTSPVALRQVDGDVWPSGVTRLRYAITSQSPVDDPATVGDAS